MENIKLEYGDAVCDSEKYWDELIYNRKLSEKEIADYELEFIGVERRVNVEEL